MILLNETKWTNHNLKALLSIEAQVHNKLESQIGDLRQH